MLEKWKKGPRFVLEKRQKRNKCTSVNGKRHVEKKD